MGMNEVHQSIICAGYLRDCWETQRKKERQGRNKQGGCKREKEKYETKKREIDKSTEKKETNLQ
jgi:hypothetical protein